MTLVGQASISTRMDGETNIREFFNEPPTLDTEVETILNNPSLLSEEQVQNLQLILREHFGEADVYGADFSMVSEIDDQIRTVRALREHVIQPNGRLREGMNARDAKEVISASTTLLGTLMKSHDKILGFERQRAMESAVVAVLKGLDPDIKAQFFSELERRMEDIQ